jgi:cell division protein ZapA
MANITIKFNGKEFLLSCEDGQEEHLDELSLHLNNRFNNLKNDLGNIGENKLLLITSIKIMDEYFETKKKIDQRKQELRDLSNKFRELRSLVYEYKDKKEQEIKQLNQEQDNFKKEIEKNKEDYEKIIEEAAVEIENFVQKVNTENSIQ